MTMRAAFRPRQSAGLSDEAEGEVGSISEGGKQSMYKN